MKFVIRLHAEITIKSKGVRKRYGKVLVNNLKKILKRVELPPAAQVKVVWCWDRIEVNVDSNDPMVAKQISEELQRIPGIAWFSQSYELSLNDNESADFTPILQQVLATWAPRLAGRSFAVRVKRKGKHGFSSLDLERYIGGGVLQNVSDTRVDLRKPDVELRIEVDHDLVRVFGDKQAGLGGFPLPTQETVVSLLSGGFDSSVASFQLLRRGARTHFCFFNLGGDRHETGVRQTAYYLWESYASSHPLKFISIDFAPVVEEILEHVDNGLMGVVLKRQMLRTAQIVARRINASALVTGEALGQVSSQTLSNLAVIDEAIESLVLRPLITMDKQEIINIAEQIGTADIARSMPEYCGVISVKPNVKAQREAVLEAEAKLDPELLYKVVRAANVEEVRHIGEQTAEEAQVVDSVDAVHANEIIIDIRSADEQEAKPLDAESLGVAVQHVPFFKLATAFAELDQDKHYLLYCEKGVMSKLQALYLHEQGYANVGVYQPKRKG
ncbi:tRNA uracil 4-sulfurtransferase ThiI [Pseudidiomarina sp.]|uniref:tRNA uracil 4-sulfurtransferase ThiI n=1 Tax=Pseudidiomarina sp. TaxID=2081707 RepID=UPI003A9770C3